MARDESMAVISGALAAQAVPSPAPQPVAGPPLASATPGPTSPQVAPALPSLTSGEKRAADVARQEKRDQAAAARQGQLDQAAAARQQQQAMLSGQRQQAAQTSATIGAASSLIQGVKDIWRGTALRLEELPQPGSITLPLVILLVFFFLLIPINGHTRLMWLWLSLSGNAQIGQTAGGPGPVPEQKSPPIPEQSTAGPPTQTLVPRAGGTVTSLGSFPLTPSFTGVEEVS